MAQTMDASAAEIAPSSPSSTGLRSTLLQDEDGSISSMTSLDAPESPLSDVPDDLSDWSEANADPVQSQPRHIAVNGSVESGPPQPNEDCKRDKYPFVTSFKRITRSQSRKGDTVGDNVEDTAFLPQWPKRPLPSPISPLAQEYLVSPRPRKKRKSNLSSPIANNVTRLSLIVRLPVPSLRPQLSSQRKQSPFEEAAADHAISDRDGDRDNAKLPDIPGPVTRSGNPTNVCILKYGERAPNHLVVAAPNGEPEPRPSEDIRRPAPTIENEELVALAKKLVLPPTDSAHRPQPSGQPEVWAETRQELCETLHYFRAWHGGTYCTGGYAWGVLHDKSPHPRDYNDGIVVLSRAGGGMVRDKDTEEMVLGRDQAENSQSASLRNSMKYRNPVVLIAGADNPLMRCKPPHAYCVLDYFKPTHIWCENSGGKVILRYRFEKLNPNKPAWWLVEESTVPLGSLSPPVVQKCTTCGHESDQVYLQGWMCLQATCKSFWKLLSGKDPVEKELLYDPRFLKQKTSWSNESHNYSLTSNNVQLSGHSVVGENCSKAYWSGMVCPQCGHCILRISWMGWECSCGFQKKPPHTLIPSEALIDPYFPLTDEYSLSRDFSLPLVGLEVRFKHNYRINVFTIPGIDGFVAHLIANKPVVEEQGGPNDMFEELQQTDIGLRRRPLGGGLTKGELAIDPDVGVFKKLASHNDIVTPCIAEGE